MKEELTEEELTEIRRLSAELGLAIGEHPDSVLARIISMLSEKITPGVYDAMERAEIEAQGKGEG